MLLAKDDITKLEAVTEMCAIDCLLNLKFESDKAVINKKRQDIIEAKNKIR